ncbi:MAG: response regulator [Thermodesulfobacteriota bacterium]
MSALGEVLVLDDEDIVCERLGDYLGKQGFSVETFTESQKAIDRLAQKEFDVVVTDLKMKGPNGLEVMHFVRRQAPRTQVIIITGYASMAAAREAEYSGVFDFITKPFQMENLGAMVKKAVKKAGKQKERSEQ